MHAKIVPMTSKKTPKKEAEKKVQKLMLLDMHAILHRGYHGMPDFRASTGEHTGALYSLVSLLVSANNELHPDHIIACYDLPKPTIRHKAFKDYKAGRSKTDDELIEQIKNSRELLTSLSIPFYELEGYEADDLLGTIVKMTEKTGEEVIVVTGDMDTLQLVDEHRVKVFTPKRTIKETILYDEQKVVEKYGFASDLLPDYKGLRGDPSDNIPGIKGIGEKTATIIISTFGDLDNVYAELDKGDEKFLAAGLKERMIGLLREGRDAAFFSKMLGEILLDAPIDFVIPEKTWTESLNLELIDLALDRWQFKTLKMRLRQSLGLVAPEPTQAALLAQSAEMNVDEGERQRAEIMLYVLDSSKTHPDLESIFEHTNTRDFGVAYDRLEKEIKDRKLEYVYESIELPLIPIIESMHTKGIELDTKVLKKLSKKYHTEHTKLEKEIYAMAGREFNINSPKQLAEILFDEMEISTKGLKKTATGARSTRESELEKLRAENEIVDFILEYRELQKLLSTYIDVFGPMMGDDGRLHTTFVQTGTTTGRLSSKDPNLQNIPIRTERGRKIRDAFVAAEGYTLLACDYSQIELRIAAMLSGDKALIEIFQSGGDIHTAVAARMFGIEEDQVDKEMRRKAKTINFGILYGMGVTSLHKGLGKDTVTRAEAQAFLDSYFATFGRLAAYLEETKQFARDNGYTETLFGRRRHFRDITSKVPFLRAAAERMAINAPIQGTQADLTKLAMVKVSEWIDKEGVDHDVRLLLQIHDELILEVKTEKVAEVAKDIKTIMESILTDKQTLLVPVIADASAGPDWGSLETIK